MKLYSHPGACSSASHIALLEAELDFDLVKLDLRSDRKLPDGRTLSDVNQKNSVPVLELDNGEILTENIAILQYIADQNPSSGLAPENGTLERYRLQEWLGYINFDLHAGIGPMFNPDLQDEVKAKVLEKFLGKLAYVEDALTAKDYLMGDQFTVADPYLFIVMSWTAMFDVKLPPNIGAFQERCMARPHVTTVKAVATDT